MAVPKRRKQATLTQPGESSFAEARTGRPAMNKALSSGTGSFSTTSSTFVDVTGSEVSLDSNGRPAHILQPDGSGNDSNVRSSTAGASGTQTTIALLRNGVIIARFNHYIAADGSEDGAMLTGGIQFMDFDAPAGVNTYKLQAKVNSGSTTAFVTNCKLVAWEP